MADRQPYLDALRQLLTYQLPPEVRAAAQALLDDPEASAYELRSGCRRCAERAVLSYPRAEVDWHPRVDAALCVGCGACTAFCPHQVYELEGAVCRVARPDACVILCAECAPLCPTGAIAFPPCKTYRELLKTI